MIENLKVRFVRKPQDLDDVLASIHGLSWDGAISKAMQIAGML